MHKRTWFGMTAVIEIRNRTLHRAGFGRLLIPHPPAVNWLLRFGMQDDSYHKLSIIHEFGHFQTLPVITAYTLAVVWWILSAHATGFVGILAMLVGIHATWEMLAELYVRSHTGSQYSFYYRGLSVLPRALFWGIMAAISAGGWVILLR